jgi:hypothetical protein
MTKEGDKEKKKDLARNIFRPTTDITTREEQRKEQGDQLATVKLHFSEHFSSRQPPLIILRPEKRTKKKNKQTRQPQSCSDKAAKYTRTIISANTVLAFQRMSS